MLTNFSLISLNGQDGMTWLAVTHDGKHQRIALREAEVARLLKSTGETEVLKVPCYREPNDGSSGPKDHIWLDFSPAEAAAVAAVLRRPDFIRRDELELHGRRGPSLDV